MPITTLLKITEIVVPTPGQPGKANISRSWVCPSCSGLAHWFKGMCSRDEVGRDRKVTWSSSTPELYHCENCS